MSPSCTNSEIASLKVVRFPTQVAQQTICQYATITKSRTGRSAAWLARLPWEQEVDGSNPFAPIELSIKGLRRKGPVQKTGLFFWLTSRPTVSLLVTKPAGEIATTASHPDCRKQIAKQPIRILDNARLRVGAHSILRVISLKICTFTVAT